MRLDPKEAYKLLSPRLLVLITTVDSMGGINAMPTTFIVPISFKPPLLMVSISPRTNTYDNIMWKKEFVVNILGKEYLDKVLRCGKHYPKGFNKLEQVGLKWYSSEKLEVPRVKEAKIWIECKFIGGVKIDHIALTDHIPIFGEVVTVDVSEDIVTEGKVDYTKISQVLHLTGEFFVTDFKISKHKRYED